MQPKVIVMIPTYNEKENIAILIKKILDLNIDALHILVVDDNSPDGTSKIVKELAKESDKVHSLVRYKIRGRGFAGIEGMKYCLKEGADYIIEMDADFSHDPRHIPQMLEEIKHCDVVVGSRFAKGGREIGRSWGRRLITKLSTMYIHSALRIKIKDCTSGYRCFRKEVLREINLDNTVSLGPSVVQELLYKAYLKGFKIHEVPIVFVDRKRGYSTFNIKIFFQGFLMVLILKFLFSHLREAEIPTGS